MIRKQKREESLAKRRFLALSPQDDDASTIQPAATQGLPAATAAGTFAAGAAAVAPQAAAAAGARPAAPGLAELPRLAAELRSGNPALELEATRAVRRMLSVEMKPPVAEVLQAGCLPLLVGFLQRPPAEQQNGGGGAAPELLFEAAWALTNIASTDHTRALVEAGATEPLARLLLHGSADVREQAAWCLGNVAGDCPELRDIVLQSGVKCTFVGRSCVGGKVRDWGEAQMWKNSTMDSTADRHTHTHPEPSTHPKPYNRRWAIF